MESEIKKDDDRLSFSLSEEEADDTTDSLDIKPPQANVLPRKTSKHKKDKYALERRSHSHSSKESGMHRKSHHHSSERRREHKEKELADRSHRDKTSHYSEKRATHREKHEQRERSGYERIREGHKSREGRSGEKVKLQELSLEDQKSEQLLRDLRGQLLVKRNIRDDRITTDEPERKKSKKDRKSREEKEERRIETEKEKGERIEREERRAKLLDAEREMALRKEVSRRELEARRERLNLEKENEKMLRDIAKKHKIDQQKEKEVVVEELPVSEESEAHESEDSEDSSDTTESEQEHTDGDVTEDEAVAHERTPESLPPLEKSPPRHEREELILSEEEEIYEEEEEEEYEEEEEHRNHKSDEEKMDVDKERDNVNYAHDSPKSEVILKEDTLPPYLPAIQGCRSVEEFQCLNRIEEGTYGVVYRARDKRTEDIVALKRLKMEKEKEGFPITSLREINTLLKAQHPNIVTVREIVVGSNMDKIFIVMDYVEHDLKSLMETMKQKKQVFLPGEIKCLMQQLLRAVAHLHDNWILHRDLKTSNLLLSHKGILKVGDFGLAREYGSPLKAYTPVVVTLWYRAPELLLQSKEYSTAIDLWSVGCIFGELLQMEALFSGRSDMDQLNKIFKELGTPNERIWPGYSKLPAIQKVTFAEYPVNQLRNKFGTVLSDLGIDLINKFLTYDPAQRITAEEALRHNYFKEAPLPIDPAMFPTWPAKSEEGHKKVKSSPKPPSGGKEYKQLGDTDDDVSASGGFHMGGGNVERRTHTVGGGFSLKF